MRKVRSKPNAEARRGPNIGPWLATLIVAGALLLVARASATPIEGRARLSLEGTVFSHQSLTIEGNPGGSISGSTLSSGSAPAESVEVSSSTTGFGIGASGLGPAVGFGLSEVALLGAGLQFATVNREFEDDLLPPVKERQISIRAFLEILLSGPRSPGRPFIGPLLGYSSLTSEQSDGEISGSAVSFGAMFGVHAFLNDYFSIDPALSVAYNTGSEDINGAEFDSRGFSIVLGFAFSGWLGSVGTAPPAEQTQPQGERPAGSAMDGVAPSPASPAAAQLPAFSTEATTHKLKLELQQGVTLHLIAKPEQTTRVDFAFMVSSKLDPNCERIELQGGDRAATLQITENKPVQVGFGSMTALSGQATLKTLWAIAKARGDDVRLEGCGASWVVGHTSRHALRRYVQRLVRIHKQGAPPPEGGAGDATAPDSSTEPPDQNAAPEDSATPTPAGTDAEDGEQPQSPDGTNEPPEPEQAQPAPGDEQGNTP